MKRQFNKEVILILAKRAGERCSLCKNGTSQPSSNPSKFVNLGEAAHIIGQKPAKNNRYSKDATSEYISSIENGIWLCNFCHKLIDSDAERFPVEFLKKLKKDHELLIKQGYFDNFTDAKTEDIHEHDKNIYKESIKIMSESEFKGLLNIIRRYYFIDVKNPEFIKLIKLQKFHSLISNLFITKELIKKWSKLDFQVNKMLLTLYTFRNTYSNQYIDYLNKDIIGLFPNNPAYFEVIFTKLYWMRKIGAETHFKKELCNDIDKAISCYDDYRLLVKQLLLL